MKKNILILLLSILACSCGKWLEIQPYDTISEEQLLGSQEGYRLLLNGIYVELCSDDLYTGTLGCEMLEILAGSYEIGSDSNVWGDYTDLRTYSYGTEYWRSRLDQMWNKAYSLVLDCNKILAGIDADRNVMTEKDFHLIKGEALALRAMLQFDMLRLFGSEADPDAAAIPYYTEVTTSPEARLSGRESLEMVIGDLEDARELLEGDPVRTEGRMMSSTDGDDSFYRYRPLRLNYFAVTALLARAELWGGNAAAALEYSREVLASVEEGIFPHVERSSVIVSSGTPDRIFSTEVLFALSHASRNTLFTSYFSPSRTTWTFRMESDLITRTIYGGGSETGGYQDDWRNRARWSGSGSNRYFYSYSDLSQGGIENTMIPLIRTGEMYLIAAEAAAMQSGDPNTALPYVNALRRNRGISSTMTELDDDLLTYEYIRELYGEGQLFFMYKRRGMDPVWGQDSRKEASEDVFVLPLPDTEADNRI